MNDIALAARNETGIIEAILEDHREILDAESQIVEQRGRGLDAALRCGRRLIEQKGALGHGRWLPWLQEHCSEIPERSAQRYLFIAKHWDLASWRPDRRGWMMATTSGHRYLYSLVGAEALINARLVGIRQDKQRHAGKSATVADLMIERQPVEPAAHTDLVLDQKLSMVAATIRGYDRQTAIVKRPELLNLRAAIDEALGRVES